MNHYACLVSKNRDDRFEKFVTSRRRKSKLTLQDSIRTSHSSHQRDHEHVGRQHLRNAIAATNSTVTITLSQDNLVIEDQGEGLQEQYNPIRS